MKIKRKTLERIKKWSIGILITATIFFVWYAYFHSNAFTITTYSIKGLSEVEIKDATTALGLASTTRTFFIIPNNKVLSFSVKNITNTLISIIPDIESLDVRPVGLHTLKIAARLYQPLLRMDDTTAVTEKGVLFSTNKNISSLPLVSIASSSIVEEQSEGRDIKRIKDVDESFLKYSKTFADKVSSVIFKVREINLDAEGDTSFINGSGTSKVLVHNGTNMNKAWSTLVSAIDTDPLKSKLKNDKETLEYLDVRFGNKVFYKFKNNKPFEGMTVPVIIENHATSTEASTTLR